MGEGARRADIPPAAQHIEPCISSDSDDECVERQIHWVDETSGSSCPSAIWPPAHYQEIRRVRFESVEQASEVLQCQAKLEEPVILEGTGIIDVERWKDAGYLLRVLKDREVLVKRSPDEHFRYFDLTKNTGNFAFEPPVEEIKRTVEEFVKESDMLLKQGSPQRLYMQETLAGHDEMVDEFATWDWKLLLVTSVACGWGLPDSNELFVGMQGVETPLHFDERENLFFQVRGRKDVCLFPWTDYVRLYPFPLTHPCDRQSMVGTPRAPDLEAFPRFAEASGHVGQLASGDLLYIPYGWWHWLRNVDHLAVSVSFWSLTKAAEGEKAQPGKLSASMFTRVRRNLESMVAEEDKSQLNEFMLQIRSAILEHSDSDERLRAVRTLLSAVQLPQQLQDRFLLEIIEGRFGIDWQRHVRGSGLQSRGGQPRLPAR